MSSVKSIIFNIMGGFEANWKIGKFHLENVQNIYLNKYHISTMDGISEVERKRKVLLNFREDLCVSHNLDDIS